MTKKRGGIKISEKKVRLAVLERDNYECQWCHRPLQNSKEQHVHHIFGGIKYLYNSEGYDSIDDLILLCQRCHNHAHRRFSPYEYMQLIELLTERKYGLKLKPVTFAHEQLLQDTDPIFMEGDDLIVYKLCKECRNTDAIDDWWYSDELWWQLDQQALHEIDHIEAKTKKCNLYIL